MILVNLCSSSFANHLSFSPAVGRLPRAVHQVLRDLPALLGDALHRPVPKVREPPPQQPPAHMEGVQDPGALPRGLQAVIDVALVYFHVKRRFVYIMENALVDISVE